MTTLKPPPNAPHPLHVLVYGLGRSGTAAAKLLRAQGHRVSCFDAYAAMPQELASLGCTWAQDPTHTDASLCIAAPGVPYDAPELQRLRARGVETIGEVEWVYRSVDARILAVTGTAGKTTTTRWLSQVLSSAGIDAPAGGNIDPALAAVARPGATLVAELSSFQLERSPTFKPATAVVLNLGQDHLDRHGTLAAYHAAKRHIIANLDAADTFIYHADDPALQRWAAHSRAQTLRFSATDRAADAAIIEQQLFLQGERLLHLKDLQVQGAHHALNACAVALAAQREGLSPGQIAAGLARFAGVAGRYSLIAEQGGVRFIEDSIATRTLAVQAALAASPYPTVWLVGGRDKGADLLGLEPLVRAHVKHAICIGEAGQKFADVLGAWVPTTVLATQDGEATMQRAVQAAAALLPQGGTVLLAPLATSFDQFPDYLARARSFERAVKDYLAGDLESDLTKQDAQNAQEAAWIPTSSPRN